MLGGGSFGTAVAAAVARAHPEADVAVLVRDASVAAAWTERRCNERYLPGVRLPPGVRFSADPEDACCDAQYLIHAVPAQATRRFLEALRPVVPRRAPVVTLTKGLEVSTGLPMHRVVADTLGRRRPVAVVSGPSFAGELAAGRPTAVVVASRRKGLLSEVQSLLASRSLRVSATRDVVGVEVCGSLKNVLAIAAGIVTGLELGDNAMAALVTQGLAEIRWLAARMGARPETVAGLSGVGDAMLTCYGAASRNRALGEALGRGLSPAQALAAGAQVAEGAATSRVVMKLAEQHRVTLPVLAAVAQVLDSAISAREAVTSIMDLPQVQER